MSIMNQKDIRNNVHRSGFDLSRRVCFTAKVGELLPIRWVPILPGDKAKSIDLNSFGRTAPLQTATFGRIREYYDVFFVPYRLLWKDFPQWIIQTKQPVTSQDLASAVNFTDQGPYFTSENALLYLQALQAWVDANKVEGAAYDDGNMLPASQSIKLLSYLGYMPYIDAAIGGDIVSLNPFPLLAYQKIYQDYFRFSQWESVAPWTYNVDFVSAKGNTMSLAVDTIPAGTDSYQKSMFSLQYCNYDRDMYNGVLPNAQYGDVSTVDVITASTSSSLFPHSVTGHVALPVISGSAVSHVTNTTVLGTTGTSQSDVKLNGFNITTLDSGNIPINLQSQFSILSLRKAEAMQKWREITQSGDLDYQSQISKHWNESVPDAFSSKCRYIGGTAHNIDVSEVINTNLAADKASPDIFGKGIISNNGHVTFENKNNEYGILMVMYHSKPIIEWNASSVMDKTLLATTVDSYPISEFDNLGNEKVMLYEMWAKAFENNKSDVVAGYAPRYYEYKTSYDIVLGEFERSLAPWVINFQRYFARMDDPNKLTYKDFKVSPHIVDNLFGVEATENTDTDHFYNSCYIDFKMVRNLSRDGLPY